jgi:hypothetical protein
MKKIRPVANGLNSYDLRYSIKTFHWALSTSAKCWASGSSRHTVAYGTGLPGHHSWQ